MSLSLALMAVLGLHAGPRGADGDLYTLPGAAPGERFGAALVGLGDVDGDGRADFAVGAPRASAVCLAGGRVSVHSGRDGRVLRILRGTSSGEQFGAVLAAVDVDGDGTLDLAVGSPRSGGSRGRVQVFSGIDGAPLWSWDGALAGERFGEALCGVGDVDGDGHGDLAVGAPFAGGAGPAAGRVTVYSGRTGGMLHSFGGQAFDLFGSAVAAASDFDGDGFGDLWIGAPLADGAVFNGGSAFLRSGRNGALLAEAHGSAIGQQLGRWLVGAGDFDGDGLGDLVVASPGDHAGGVLAGAVEVRSAAGALLLRVVGSAPGAQLGTVAMVGDLDGDGRSELLLGAPQALDGGPGRALVVRGPLASERTILIGARPGDWFGTALAGPGDLDGDGRPDFVVGAPGDPEGSDQRGYVRVYSGRHFTGRR
jgi:hypothetical protein